MKLTLVSVLIISLVLLFGIQTLFPEFLDFIGNYFTIFAFVALLILLGTGRKIQ